MLTGTYHYVADAIKKLEGDEWTQDGPFWVKENWVAVIVFIKATEEELDKNPKNFFKICYLGEKDKLFELINY